MKVKNLSLYNYRNYVKLNLEFKHNLNIFVGQNAQGKTNILESIYVGAMGRSHRTNTDQELIHWYQPGGSINMTFTRQDIENKLSFKFISDQNKEIILNGQTIKVRDLIGQLNAVMFSPEDLMLIKGAPVGRRKFLDSEISQANPAYYRNLLQYNRIVAQRNNLLKKIRECKARPEMLDTWDAQIASSAAIIVNKRQDALKKLTMLANLMHRKITASRENLTITYFQCGLCQPVNHIEEWYLQQMANNRHIDIARGSTSVGPHRDDLIFNVNGINLRNFGSQGQQRTGVLALKLAEIEFIKSETGEYPVLLLDDVMSELDASRREQLLSFIKDRIQTFITATEPKYFSEHKMGHYYSVVEGKVEQFDWK
ncbi:DNA replication and repair protein RecF [bioreactor metagenome]|uniref:DNA replication and repair protein RecF n=1 Tax=bioreactor metagenome TaxID=1076179 RepID=A0A644SVS6_9ZZZZ|nr:DNA replication/repair protein RecF [Negativicutes bacterium]